MFFILNADSDRSSTEVPAGGLAIRVHIELRHFANFLSFFSFWMIAAEAWEGFKVTCLYPGTCEHLFTFWRKEESICSIVLHIVLFDKHDLKSLAWDLPSSPKQNLSLNFCELHV